VFARARSGTRIAVARSDQIADYALLAEGVAQTAGVPRLDVLERPIGRALYRHLLCRAGARMSRAADPE
jgi:hypothetical protein